MTDVDTHIDALNELKKKASLIDICQRKHLEN